MNKLVIMLFLLAGLLLASKGAQDLAGILLDAEAKLGEMLGGIEPQSSQQGRLRTLPEGISYKESPIAQTIANHPEVVAKAIEERGML